MARQFKPGQLQTGSLFNISSSYALTASFALNGGGGGASSFPYTGSAIISGSLGVTGSFNQASSSLASGLFAHVQGFANTASGAYSHAEGQSNVATGQASHAEGQLTTANGPYSHAEGYGTITNGFASHTEGQSNVATGQASHAEGLGTTATGVASHAEGNTTTATGEGSHAEGSSTVANGQYSHAEGLGTIAQGAYQHVQGQYNQSSSAQGAFIVGNGTGPESLRSNLIFASDSQVQITGSVIATAGFIGSLQGTATTADQPSGDWIPGKPDPNGISPYNLGSPESAWNSLYVNHGTIYFISQSVGQPTTSASISIRDNTFIFNATDAQGNTSETVISGDGRSGYFIATGSVTASVAVTGDIFIIRSASYNPFTVSGTGLTTISGSASNLFLIKNASNQAVLTVSQSGVVILATSSVELTGPAPNGGIYFTSNSLFVGLD